MNRWKWLTGIAVALWVLASAGAFGLNVYFGERMPTKPDPATGRVRKHLYHSKTVYLTVPEDRVLLGLYGSAGLAFAALFLIDRYADPFNRRSKS